MKRRSFLTATSTFGIVGAVSGATIVSSTFTNIHTSALLEEFCPTTRKVLDRFLTEAILNVEAQGLDEKYARHLAMPVQIISKKTEGNHQKMVYQNKSGEYISLSVNKGQERIELLKTA